MSTAHTTPEVVRLGAQKWPAAEALIDGEVRFTFAELRDHVTRASAAARAAGIHKGDRAAIWAPNMHEWVIAALGLHGAGAVIVPLNTRYKGDEAAYVLTRSGARLLFTVEGFLGNDYVGMLAGRQTPIERTVLFRHPSWDEYLAAAANAPGPAPAAGNLSPAVTEDDLSDIIFTSGTTGRPKGVMSTHYQTVRVFRDWCSIVGLRAGDRYLVVTPFFHTFGYKAGFVAALNAGACTILLPTVEVPAVLELVSRERVTTLPATPTLFQDIFRHPDRNRYDLSSLRLSAVGAASVPAQLVERMRAELFSTVVTGYGLTETTGVATMSRPEDPPELIARSVGRALPDVEIRVVGSDGRNVLPGSPGEILVRGYNVMRGYFDAPEQTRQAIDTDGWLHTGDVGTMDEAGYVAITDRLKDMFIVGGFNAYPAEIEAALLRHPDVAMVAVVGIPDRRLGEVGMAFIVPAGGTFPTEESIIAWSRTEMANYKVPRRVAFVEALPLNAVGKVLKDELRARVH
jgi:acyl-CoA synthetase (AMP-forming)/AMP-acid ligase II